MDIKTLTNNLLEFFYILTGLIMLTSTVFILRDAKHPARYGSAAFWAILGIIFMAGKYIPSAIIGGMVVVLGILTFSNQVKVGTLNNSTDSFRADQALKIGSKIFIPSLAKSDRSHVVL